MATRKDAAGISGRTITIENNGKFDRIKTISEANTILTGSLQGARGFIIESAGNTVLSPTKGDVINASALNAKELYEIGLVRVSGSGKVHVVYP
jgi:hypothetical protein|tara:strand:+ start:278 stop:559 length:282 start_codon:yes stop_codon:yes gene_type:complete